jgi:hypothetical protein
LTPHWIWDETAYKFIRTDRPETREEKCQREDQPMPWIPVKYMLRRMREARGWTIADLAKKTKVSDRQLVALESRNPPSFVQTNTADVISQAFDLKLIDFKKWPLAERWILWVPHGKGEDVDADDVKLGQVGTLPKLAKMERDLGLHAVTIQTSAGPADLLSLDRLHKIMTLPKHYADKPFVVVGKVDQHASMPSSAAKKIGAVVDEGAVFRVTRAVAKRLPQYVSVFTPNAKITHALMDAYDAGERMAMLVRVVFAPPAGPWRGFFFIEDGPPKSKKFAFAVEKLVTETA